MGWTNYLLCRETAGDWNVIWSMDSYESLEMHDVCGVLMQYDYSRFFQQALYFIFSLSGSLGKHWKNFPLGRKDEGLFGRWFTRWNLDFGVIFGWERCGLTYHALGSQRGFILLYFFAGDKKGWRLNTIGLYWEMGFRVDLIKKEKTGIPKLTLSRREEWHRWGNIPKLALLEQGKKMWHHWGNVPKLTLLEPEMKKKGSRS